MLRTLPPLRAALPQGATRRVALVPTMGALHAGHLALVRQAKRRAGRVVVSIFVNPTQFAPHEDFGSYPRTFDADIAALTEAERSTWSGRRPRQSMYPDGFATRIAPAGAAKAGLEDKFRPHFFGGVATVVAKLFTQVAPDFAMFGEKDYQQLRVVTQMAKDLDLPVKVVGVPTVREKRRPRAVLAQRLSVGEPSAASRRRFTACSRRAPRASKAASRSAACSTKAANEIDARRLCARLPGGAPRR